MRLIKHKDVKCKTNKYEMQLFCVCYESFVCLVVTLDIADKIAVYKNFCYDLKLETNRW